jgi:REP element-mobilizing transposase RayT
MKIHSRNSPYLPGFSYKKALSFGGFLSKSKGNPKTQRPLVTRQAIHLVLKSSKATGKHSLLLFHREIEILLRKQARDFGVKIYAFANAGNHLHLLIRIHNRRNYRAFIRAISGLIMRKVFGFEKGHGGRHANLWDARPFTRIVAWGKDFLGVKDYLLINELETEGFLRGEIRALMKIPKGFLQNGKLAALPTGF